MSNEYILEMRAIDKEFPGVKALQNVDFKLGNKEIHGLVGENGAGKSTLMKILAGIYQHDGGDIIFEGQTHKHITPRVIEQLGITFIHQERYVVPHLTVAESLFLGIEPTKTLFKFMNRKELEAKAEKLLKEKVGFEVKGNTEIRKLTVGEQQLVQICRALMTDPKVIVFDEPTAVLAKGEAERLFEIIRELGKEISVIYISHYFGEILDLCDKVTVLRNGQFVDSKTTEGMTIADLVCLMIGRDIGEQYPPKESEIGDVLLDVKDLTHEKHFEDVSFTIRKGQVVGFTGLMGSGHSEIGTSIYDTTGIVGGEITFEGKTIKSNNHEKAVKLGMGYVPEDRRGLGVIQKMSVKENTTLSSMGNVSKKGIINRKEEASAVDKLIDRLGIKTPGGETVAGFLSGGNQQKIIIARWIARDVKLYILNQPTSGVDIGARAEIYSLIRQMTDAGAGVLLITQDINELIGLSDTVHIMYRGKVRGVMDVESDISDQVNVVMMGGDSDEQ